MIEMKGIKKHYTLSKSSIPILQSIDLTIPKGSFISLMGPSGSGKTTLMNLIGCLDRPSSGIYRFQGRDISTATPEELASIRCHHIGFIFQSFHLLANLTLLENVELPMIYANVPKGKRRERAEELLEAVGLKERLTHRPVEISGGQRQRVAIARALVNQPALLVADEPTGNLDSHAAQEIMEIFHQLHQQGKTIVMVTHEPTIAQNSERIIRLVDGSIVSST